MLAAAIALSAAYGGGLSGRALLLQPLIDQVALPNASLGSFDHILESASPAEAAELAREREQLRSRVQENFERLLLFGALLVVGMPLVRVGRDYAADWLMGRIFVDMQRRVGDKLLRLPLSHHQRDGRGEFVARITNDVAIANRSHFVIFGDFLQDIMQLIFALVLAFFVSWQLALVLILVGPPVAFVLRHFGERIRRASRRRQEQVAEVTSRLVQMLSGIKVIKAFHAEERERGAFGSALERFFRRSMRVVVPRVVSRGTVELVTQGSFVAVLLIGVFAILEGVWGLTLGRLAAFAALAAMLARPMRSLASTYTQLQDSIPAADRLFEILDAPEVPADPGGALGLPRVEKSIRYSDVSFNYGRERVLEHVNLEIGAGEIVALVGRTGSGKTTLADLLMRFHDPDEGTIEIDGVDLRKLRRKSLHGLCAVVTQEPFLFDDTIAENIRYGRPDASDAEVREAARAANADGFIERLPAGYETQVGDAGSQLSGGQRQRITIARAILRDPQVLIFDEATSSLDADAEAQVHNAILRLMRGRTVLLIAHRLSTVRSADRIVVLDQGRVVQTGSHEKLLRQGGLYADLVALQLEA
jgi:subfamily B ATP-binding cassette protein MsbA